MVHSQISYAARLLFYNPTKSEHEDDSYVP